MSSTASQSNTWTPDTIANVAYRVVMVVVSLAFIWRMYCPPVRAMDEEYLTGDQLPTPHRCHLATTNKSRHISTPRLRSSSAVASLVAAQLNTLVEIASGLGYDQIYDNGPKVSMDGPSSSGKNSTESAATGVGMDNMYLNCQMGVDLNLGDLGLRIRPGECSTPPRESRYSH